jgi:hypothetical protein
MKRYFGTINTTLANITSIVRTNTGITVNGTETISLWTRTNTSTNFPVKYNGILSKTRQVALLPESTDSNTLITRDGLILVINGTDLTVSDLFDEGFIDYDTINPSDYDALLEYATGINPEHKRIFTISGRDVNNNFIVKNNKIYTESGVVYFQTDMDLDLETDDYGYYGTESFSQTTTTFSLIKKQFYLLEAPAGTTLYVSGILKSPISGTQFYFFSDLDIDNEDKFIEFQLRNDTISSGTIIIY